MKWFKHQTENNSFIFKLVELFGGDGYLIYYRTREMIAEEFDIKNPGKAQFSVKKMTNFIQVSAGKLRKVLNFLTKSEQIFAEFIDNGVPSINLYDPELQELTDEYTTKKIGTVSGQTPDNVRKKSPQIRLDKIRTDKNRTDKSTISGKPDDIPYGEIISYLNKKTGKHYQPDKETNRKWIRARWREGFRIDDFRRVIDNKCSDWLNDVVNDKFLRPETLFGNKFEGYLNQKRIDPRLAGLGPAGKQTAIAGLEWLERSKDEE